MALEIVWSPLAQKKRKEILVYWKERNGNSEYSNKLNALFIEAVKLPSKFPNIGKDSDIKGVKEASATDTWKAESEFVRLLS